MTSSKCLFIGIVLCLAIVPTVHGQGVEKEWQELKERADKGEKNVSALRADLARLRLKRFGTPQALQAAGLLRDLASPLDQLDAKNIPPLERFAWHPKETVAVLGEHRGRQAGAVTAVCWSRNSKWLASTSTNGLIRIWDPTTMRLLHTLGHGGGAFCAVFSKDNSLLLHGGGDGQVVVVDMKADPPKVKETARVASTALLGVAVSPDAKWFVTGGSDTRLCLWDIEVSPPVEVSAGNAHGGAIHAVLIGPDGKTIVSAGADKMIRTWSYVNNKLAEKSGQEAHAGAVLCLAWHPTDEKTLVSGGGDAMIRVWNITAGKLTLRNQFKGPTTVNSVAFTPGGKTLAAAYADGIVRAYTYGVGGTLAEKSVLEGHMQAATAVAYAPDASSLASGSSDWTVRLWPTVTGPRPRDKTVKSGHLSHVYTTAFSPDEKGLASGSYDNTLRYWTLPASLIKEHMPPMKGNQAVYTIAFAPDAKTLAAGGAGANFQSYDPHTGKALVTFTGHQGQISKLTYAPDGKTVASVSTDKSLRLWNPATGKQTDAITSFENYINGVAYSPDGKNLLCCSGYYLLNEKGQVVYRNGQPLYLDSTVRLYDTFLMKESFRWKSELLLASCLAFSADGKQFFAGVSDGIVRRWDTAMPTPEPGTFYKGNGGTSLMMHSPDGRWLVTYGPDYRVNLFDMATGKVTRSFTTAEQFGSVCIAPDSRHLAISLATGVTLILRLENAK